MLVAPLPLDEEDLLDLLRQHHLPDQLRGQVLEDKKRQAFNFKVQGEIINVSYFATLRRGTGQWVGEEQE